MCTIYSHTLRGGQKINHCNYCHSYCGPPAGPGSDHLSVCTLSIYIDGNNGFSAQRATRGRLSSALALKTAPHNMCAIAAAK